MKLATTNHTSYGLKKTQKTKTSLEQTLMLESTNLIVAVFSVIAAHYIFNLSYHLKSGDFWVFIQERMMGIPSKKTKRHPSSATHFTGITIGLLKRFN